MTQFYDDMLKAAEGIETGFEFHILAFAFHCFIFFHADFRRIFKRIEKFT